VCIQSETRVKIGVILPDSTGDTKHKAKTIIEFVCKLGMIRTLVATMPVNLIIQTDKMSRIKWPL